MTEALREEHQRIKILLELVGRVVERLVRSGEIPGEVLDGALSLLHSFVDHYHHEREELLFRALEACQAGPGGAPLRVLGEDHDRLRSLIAAARAQTSRAAEGNAEAIATLAHVTREYAKLTLDHLEREEFQLFDLADELLAGEEAVALERELQEDLSRRREGWLAQLDQDQERLAASYGSTGVPD